MLESLWRDAELGSLKKEKEGSDIVLVKGEEVRGVVKAKEGKIKEGARRLEEWRGVRVEQGKAKEGRDGSRRCSWC